MVKSRIWVMAKKFQGAPKLSDFAIKEQELPPLKDGGRCLFLYKLRMYQLILINRNFAEFLCKAEFLSIDPYQRAYASSFPDGAPMIGYQVAE